MSKATTLIGGAISPGPISATAKGARLFLSRNVPAALLAAAVLSAALPSFVERVMPSSASPVSYAAEPSPVGSWHCRIARRALGVLTVEGWRYALAIDGAPPAEGGLAPVGGRTPKNNMALVHVESGPLKDQFGIRLGFYDNRSQPEQLTFNIGPGAGISCAPA